MNRTILRPMSTVVEASCNSLMELFFRPRCLLTAIVTEVKNAISDNMVWFSSVVSEIVPIVLLMTQDIVMYLLLQSNYKRPLATMFGILAIAFSLSARAAGDKCVVKKHLR